MFDFNMIDDTIDVTNIVYANEKTKLTMKSKEVLDDLAKKTELWKNEEWRTNFESPIVQEKSRNSSINSFTDGYRTPESRRLTISNKEFMGKLQGSVKAKVAMFEKQSNDISTIKCQDIPKRKVLQAPIASFNAKLEQNISFKLDTIQHNASFKNKENISPLASTRIINTNLDSIKEHVEMKPKRDSVSETPSDKSETLPPPPPISMFSDTPVVALGDISVEDLNKSRNESTPLKYESDADKLDVTSELSNEEVSEDESLTDISYLNATKDESNLPNSINEISLYDDFLKGCDEFSHSNNFPHYHDKYVKFESPKPASPVKRDRIRHSISFNEEVKIINDTVESDLSSYEEVSSYEEEDSIYEEKDMTRHITDESDDYLKTGNFTFVEDMEYNRDELKEEQKQNGKILSKKTAMLSDLLKTNEKLGGNNHVEICRQIVEYKTRATIVAEQLARGQRKRSLIDGCVEITNLKIQLRRSMALVHLKDLTRPSMNKKWNKIKELHHILVNVHCKAMRYFAETDILTLMTIEDANKLGIGYNTVYELSLMKEFCFTHVQPKTRVTFDVYTMTVNPSEDNRKTSMKSTPLSKLFRGHSDKSPAVTSVNANSERIAVFSSEFQFDLSLEGLKSKDLTLQDQVQIHNSSIFSGFVSLKAKFNLTIAEKFCGKLNIFCDNKTHGDNWIYYKCELQKDGLCGESIDPKQQKRHLFLPYSWLKKGTNAERCDFHICAKSNSFCCVLDPRKLQTCSSSTVNKRSSFPVSKRRSLDGNQKHRFLAEAATNEEANNWCTMINAALASYQVFNNTQNMSNN